MKTLTSIGFGIATFFFLFLTTAFLICVTFQVEYVDVVRHPGYIIFGGFFFLWGALAVGGEILDRLEDQESIW